MPSERDGIGTNRILTISATFGLPHGVANPHASSRRNYTCTEVGAVRTNLFKDRRRHRPAKSLL